MGFFQQRLQLILQPYFVPRPLILGARECPPQTGAPVYQNRSEVKGNCAGGPLDTADADRG
jgi:hypothetical protein